MCAGYDECMEDACLGDAGYALNRGDIQDIGSWVILQLISGKVAAISLQLFLVIVAAIFGQSCSIYFLGRSAANFL